MSLRDLLSNRKPPAKLRLSWKGALFVASFEGFEAYPYNDVGNAAIGFGHRLHEGPVTAADRKRWNAGITRHRACVFLVMDLEPSAQHVRANITAPLTQHAFDALVSFVFNVGEAGVNGSTLQQKLNRRNYRGASNEILRWDMVNGEHWPGLLKRRIAERNLFRNGSYQHA